MSYDIYFKVKVANTNSFVDIVPSVANITYNLGEMIRTVTNLPWNNEENNGYVKDIIPFIQLGLDTLKKNPSYYRFYEAKNGWGTVENAERFFTEIIDAWNILVAEEDPEVVSQTTFWIL